MPCILLINDANDEAVTFRFSEFRLQILGYKKSTEFFCQRDREIMITVLVSEGFSREWLLDETSQVVREAPRSLAPSAES